MCVVDGLSRVSIYLKWSTMTQCPRASMRVPHTSTSIPACTMRGIASITSKNVCGKP